MTEKEIILTPGGLVALEKELEELKSVRLIEVAARIKEALAFGDISENSEFDDAKNEQAFIQGRIVQIEKMIRFARVVTDDGSVDESLVSIGRRVQLEDIETGDIVEYRLVGTNEADPSRCRISNESPVGKAILGKTPGDVVEVEVDEGDSDGVISYRVLKVSRELEG